MDDVKKVLELKLENGSTIELVGDNSDPIIGTPIERYGVNPDLKKAVDAGKELNRIQRSKLNKAK